MGKSLFCITCSVDNGCIWKRYNVYVFANSEPQAKLTVRQYWDSQYDTTSTIESAKIVDDYVGRIVCMREIRCDYGKTTRGICRDH